MCGVDKENYEKIAIFSVSSLKSGKTEKYSSNILSHKNLKILTLLSIFVAFLENLNFYGSQTTITYA